MAFAERFELLAVSGQVSAQTVEAAQALLAGIAAYLGRPLDEEADAMAATHLVLAMERIRTGDVIQDPPEVLLTEARSYATEWAAASALLESAAARWGRPAPPAELAYLTIHLCSLKRDSA